MLLFATAHFIGKLSRACATSYQRQYLIFATESMLIVVSMALILYSRYIDVDEKAKSATDANRPPIDTLRHYFDAGMANDGRRVSGYE